jgi:hypothetical protein
MPVQAIDAPVGGLNAFDSTDNMPPTDAIILDNWVPKSGFVESRRGCVKHSLGLGGPVETVVGFKSATEYQVIAAANGKLWDVTDEGTGVEIGAGPYANDRWQTVMMNDRLILCNGADPEMSWDGTTLANLDYTGSEPPITPGEFVGVTSFKGRAFYWKEESTIFWYAPAGSFQGELEPFDLGSFAQDGGAIQIIFTWTVDSGTGPDDMICFLFTTGEMMLYQGDDPGNLGYFEQVGRFKIPDPLSNRCAIKYGADVIIMTANGYVNLTTVLRQDQMSDYPEFSRKIARLVDNLGRDYGQFFGHQGVLTDDGLMLFNVPTGFNQAIQYVFNTSTAAWTRFTAWNALTVALVNHEFYFGAPDGYVYHALFGTDDDGVPIALDAVPAFNYYGDAGAQKHLVAAQILSTHPDPKLINIEGIADFVVPELNNTTAPAGLPSDILWDTALWNTIGWTRTGEGKTTKGWQNISTFGFASTVVVQMKMQGQTVVWRQSNIRYRNAGAQ